MTAKPKLFRKVALEVVVVQLGPPTNMALLGEVVGHVATTVLKKPLLHRKRGNAKLR
jgi:hypothetical protein